MNDVARPVAKNIGEIEIDIDDETVLEDTVLSDEDNAGRHTAVLALEPAAGTSAVLRSLLEQGMAVNSFRELIPRMNDIFIKLVTEGA